jgi:hypothetical protein
MSKNQDSGNRDQQQAGRNADQTNTKPTGADKTAADFDETVRQADEERGELKPGQKNGNPSKQHNNGRGGGK